MVGTGRIGDGRGCGAQGKIKGPCTMAPETSRSLYGFACTMEKTLAPMELRTARPDGHVSLHQLPEVPD